MNILLNKCITFKEMFPQMYLLDQGKEAEPFFKKKRFRLYLFFLTL